MDNNVIEIQVAGENPGTWQKHRKAFMDKIRVALDSVLNQIVDPINRTTLKDESNELLSLGINHIKARLAKSGIENEHTLMEIRKKYAEITRINAETRKTIAEANSQEFETKLKQLLLSLGGAKIFLINSQDEESLIFLKEIDEWTILIRQLMKNN